MSLWAVLATGLLAGGASCAAVQGGLLAGAVARRHPEPVTATKGKARRGGRPARPPTRSALEDAVPVGSFLAAKLVSHALLGALLGLLGDAVQLSVRTRAVVQIAAGVVMVLLALDLFGVSVVRRALPAPPAAWGRVVCRKARWSSAYAPAVFGTATILIPCGVTLGMEFLAIASGSALAGAAIMATFVIGTSPLFAAIGYAARRSTTLLRGRLSVLAAAAVLIAGLVSVNTGLVLADSSVTLTSAVGSLTPDADSGPTGPPAALPPLGPDGVQHVTLTATDGGASRSHRSWARRSTARPSISQPFEADGCSSTSSPPGPSHAARSTPIWSGSTSATRPSETPGSPSPSSSPPTEPLSPSSSAASATSSSNASSPRRQEEPQMAKTSSRRPTPSRTKASAAKKPPSRSAGKEVLIGFVVVLGGLLLFLAVRSSDEPPDQLDGGTAGVTGPDFHSLVADPTTPGRLYVGGHQAVSESTDGGKTWTRVPSLDDADAMGWGFQDGAVFVSGHPGLNRSNDGATSFTRINDGIPGTDVHAFGAGQDVLYGSAVDGGLFASSDDGATWEVRATDGAQPFFGRVVVDPDDDEHLFAADAQRGVAESTDGGRTWTVLDSGLPAATWLSRRGDSLELLIASGPAGAARSTDGGRSWTRLDVPAGASLVEIAPEDPEVLYAGTHEGSAVRVQVSRDGGRTWAPA